jgi:hypothetical protein
VRWMELCDFAALQQHQNTFIVRNVDEST